MATGDWSYVFAKIAKKKGRMEGKEWREGVNSEYLLRFVWNPLCLHKWHIFQSGLLCISLIPDTGGSHEPQVSQPKHAPHQGAAMGPFKTWSSAFKFPDNMWNYPDQSHLSAGTTSFFPAKPAPSSPCCVLSVPAQHAALLDCAWAQHKTLVRLNFPMIDTVCSVIPEGRAGTPPHQQVNRRQAKQWGRPGDRGKKKKK